jgi:hypothetical protein
VTVHRTPNLHESTLLRLLGWLFGCSETINAHRGALSMVAVARCRKHASHRGDHEFVLPEGWEPGL